MYSPLPAYQQTFWAESHYRQVTLQHLGPFWFARKI